jgi:small subunit ribosomal protein S8
MDRMSEMLNAIKNASMARRKSIEAFYSIQCEAVAKVLKEKGFLSEVKVFKDGQFKRLNIVLAYDGKLPLVSDIQRISKSGRRQYKGYEDLHRIQAGLGVSVVSTSRGIMSGDEARKKKLGGEVICEVK